ncbi:hypothetical protein QJQ45_001411 [Haematococcus lacustris]|nr:hypothetical protein QJQ45_001411 [Haematococcus lacustris]
MFLAHLMRTSAIRVQLDRQCSDRVLTPRVIAALRARTSKLDLALEHSQTMPSGQFMELLVGALEKLGSCAAVASCQLRSVRKAPLQPLDCTSSLAQRLLASFPSLTGLSLHGYCIAGDALGSLLSHPQLSQQLQQLDLTGSTLTEPWLGAMTLLTVFYGLRLQQLSLDIGEQRVMPDLQPLAQHLTRLHVARLDNVESPFAALGAALRSLPQLQILTVSSCTYFDGLPKLLGALPQLHSLLLPNTTITGQGQLRPLLQVTQITSLLLQSVQELTSSCAGAACSWQHLELTGKVDFMALACLPLHSLTQPLLLGELRVSAGCDTSPTVAAAACTMAQACSVPLRIKVLLLYTGAEYHTSPSLPADAFLRQNMVLQKVVSLMRPLQFSCDTAVFCDMLNVCAAFLPALAALCPGCIRFELQRGSLIPSLDFWRQLVQRIPTISHVTIRSVKGDTSAAMCKSLQRMAEHSWAWGLDITVCGVSTQLPTSCQALNTSFNNPSQPGKIRIEFRNTD